MIAGCQRAEEKKAGTTLVDYEAVRDQVVAQIKTKQLGPDASGVVDLPEALRTASVGGRAIYSRDTPMGLMVVLNLSLNAGPRQEFLVYSEKDVATPSSRIDFGGLAVVLDKKLDGEWYHARMVP